MISMTLADIAQTISGVLILGKTDATEQTSITGLTDTDSRLITPGDIFVAKPGEFTDGHLFIPAAVENGAAVVIVDHEVDTPVPQIVVADTVVALGALATEVVARVRAKGNLTVVGITGSNGKTTTKNLVAAMCEQVGPTVFPRDSFNNEVGMPITMLKISEDTTYLVLEMGASGKGHITRLTNMVRPDIAVELMVGLAHAGEFGGVEVTVESKRELVEALGPEGIAILNKDDPRVMSMASAAPGKIITFGHSPEADVRISQLSSSISGTQFDLNTPEGIIHVNFKVLGEHHAMNAAAATAVALTLGFDLELIKSSLQSVTRAEHWRMELMGGNGVTIINDAYNASPDSMAAALKTLRQVAGPENRTIAVLGEMAELGAYAGEEQDNLALLIVRLGIDQLVVVGDGARRLHISAINEGSWDGESKFYSTPDEAYDYLSSLLRAGDIVLVKSSNSAKLRFLGDRLGEAYA
ncbi:UDP-N-acetylmuramoyl-tripeptide--D-alanyl-D-alanine ligase [Aurantimicrobium minutum]|uniref:UDP-N-acetylmuramoyl-tripeptide--D-alanyl-D- alanine ligase n=1 Tax=Aurantimicrobium minutum TaxID=708131 RepID=UPI0024771243|nr:UDP-N-acetylmuramoyl-tripeptide--D-alanyl-D-alanine ligase [Aurantimicrobium minutum]MDH6422438.1 UDP-N-acetylmuramoyl-tripeptide--D-alanyl-D-alanine ligase [Aurantimicrobium minutum]